MKSIYMPDESFLYKDDLAIINKAISLMSSTVFEEIDDRLEIWILGNKDKDFFSSQIQIPLKELRVIDPVDNMPIPEFRSIQHLVVVNCSFERNNGSAVEYYFGNTDYHLYDFIISVLILLGNKFPKNNQKRENSNPIDEVSISVENGLLNNREKTRSYWSNMILKNNQ